MNAHKHDKGRSLHDKLKEGVSVQELESFARKYTNEGLIILAIFFAAISSMFHFFSGPGWSVAFIGLGAIVSIALPDKTSWMLEKITNFIGKTDKTLQIFIGILRIVIALFLPFIFFGYIGLLAGTACHYYIMKASIKKPSRKKEDAKADESEEEHL